MKKTLLFWGKGYFEYKEFLGNVKRQIYFLNLLEFGLKGFQVRCGV